MEVLGSPPLTRQPKGEVMKTWFKAIGAFLVVCVAGTWIGSTFENQDAGRIVGMVFGAAGGLLGALIKSSD